ncbi:CDP-glycerol glycerophosphotransferase family protein [Aeromicrobium sp. Leaf245]|uniref:CDP-glycerol glycerophosphotransferase family protein n=1 Tax=Aeromicrobium sp. Leaf245 TaxID=1736306 RepID=UPI000AB6E620|nr:CDP-glycerol glycerophosphotransferase family protein [Aeromicrobium sp. Leaf245]
MPSSPSAVVGRLARVAVSRSGVALLLSLALPAVALLLVLGADSVGTERVALALVAVSLVGEYLLLSGPPAVRTGLHQASLGIPVRFVVRLLAVLTLLNLPDDRTAHTSTAFVGLAMLVALCGRALHHEYRRVGSLRPLRTRNIPGDPSIAVEPPARVLEVCLAQAAVLVVGPLGAPFWLVLLVGVLAVAALAYVTVPDARTSWRMRQAKRATGFTPALRQVQDFLDEYQPEVVLHLSGPLGSAYQVNTWLESLEALDRRVLVVLRDAPLFDTIRDTDLPTLQLANAGELLMLDFASVKVALYPSNTGNNIHLLRLPHIMSAFVGHGDSDKSASANPFSRVYDELWVAGEAGADRYRKSGLGIHESQFRFVGRPQVHSISSSPRVGEEDVPTILYAPTWEGVNTLQEYSSISAVGARIVEAVLGSPTPARLVYKPHPFTGQRDAKYRAVDAAIAARVREAAASSGIDHKVVRSGPIEPWFNRATALFTDVSSVVSDFLASEKPIAVFNHTGHGGTPLDETTFRAEYPSASAATIVGPDGSGIEELVQVATGQVPDARAAERTRLATYLLGAPEKRTLESFRASVEAFIARAEGEREQYFGQTQSHDPSDSDDSLGDVE